MALIKCPECGHSVSDKAPSCPNCGYPLIAANEIEYSVIEHEDAGVDAITGLPEMPLTEDAEESTVLDQGKMKMRAPFYQKTWFAILMLLFFFPVGVLLIWKFRKFHVVARIIVSVVFCIWFLFWVLIIVALALPCEHDWEPATCLEPKTCLICGETEGSTVEHSWVDATCTEPKHCIFCNEIEGAALGHAKGEWIVTQAPTLSDEGTEEFICVVCSNSLNSKTIQKKNPEVQNTSFNFTDDELIDWANSWLNGTYKIDDSGAYDLGSNIFGYSTKTDDGAEGMLLLKHDNDGNVAAIMIYFDNFVDRAALALFFGTKINSAFIYDDAAEILANNSTYFAADMIATNLTLDDGVEVALLTPEAYMYKIISGTPLTLSDGFVVSGVSNNESLYAKYDYNAWALLQSEYGDDAAAWFYNKNIAGVDPNDTTTTYRGISIGVSTEMDIISAYGQDMSFVFNKNTDVFYDFVAEDDPSEYKFLLDTKKVLVYDYQRRYQLAFFIDKTGVVDCIVYFSSVWYDD